MRMDNKWNHTVHLHRQGFADAWGHISDVVVPVGSPPLTHNARPDQNWSGTLQDRGPGEQQDSKRRWFLDKSVHAVRERDVLLVIAGPEAVVALRVVSAVPITTLTRVNHIEVNVEVWQGEISEGVTA